MLILPPGHGRALAEPRRLRPRERWIVGSVGALAAALLVVVVIALADSSSPRRGCIDVTIASSLGGQPLSGCGSRARRICAAAERGAWGGSVLAACERAGLAGRARAR